VDQFHFPGMKPFAVPAGLPEYIDQLKSWFPEEAGAVDKYFAELRQSYLYGLLYYFKGVSNEYVDRYEKVTMTEKLNEHFRDPRIKAVLMADTPHWGSLPNRTSYLFDAMLRLSYFLGNYFPKGGSQQFADDLGRAFTERGGKILKCAAVEKIHIAGGRATGVRVRTAAKRAPEWFEFEAGAIIANGDALHTYRDLIGEEHCGAWIIDGLKAMIPSYACFLMHFGLRGLDPEALAKTEGYYWTSYDPGDAIRNVFKVFIPTHFDPDIAPPGCQIVIIQKLQPGRIEDVTDWPAHKARVEEHVMSRLRDIIPGIEEHTVVRLSASALTSQKYTGNYQGAMLGWEMSPEQLGAGRLPFYTPIDNIHLVGHWTQPGGGITPVIVSAQRVARTILTGRDEGRDLAAQYFAFRNPGRAAEAPAELKEDLR
jgi:phytoene dehydrogenase-like protein